jgi:hypothetical protein
VGLLCGPGDVGVTAADDDDVVPGAPDPTRTFVWRVLLLLPRAGWCAAAAAADDSGGGGGGGGCSK